MLDLERCEPVRHLYGLLASLGGAEWTFRQALTLFDHCRTGSPLSAEIKPPPKYSNFVAPWFTLQGWELMCARDGALAIYHFGQALDAIPKWLRNCPTLYDRVDHATLRLARRLFKAAFPSHDAIRHVVGHAVDFSATIKERERHSITRPWRRAFDNLTIQMVGPRPMYSAGDLIDRVYKVTYDGDVHYYEIKGESLERLSAIRERTYEAFKAVVDLDFYTCFYCGSQDLKEVYGRRIYQCVRCDQMVTDELMIRAKYHRLRAAAAETAPTPITAT